jgi:hypothetical protein
MPDEPADAKKQFEALKNSLHLLQEFLEAAQRNPSDWEYKIVKEKRTIAEGPLNKQAQEIFGALGGLLLGPPGPPCPERTGCVAIGRDREGQCRYICKKPAAQP